MSPEGSEYRDFEIILSDVGLGYDDEEGESMSPGPIDRDDIEDTELGRVQEEEDSGRFAGDLNGPEDLNLSRRCNIIFYPREGLMRCMLCQTPTILRTGIKDHMRRLHGVTIPAADLRRVKARFFQSNNPYFVPTRTMLPPITFLPIHRGFQCQSCIYYCARKAVMQEHYRKKHPNEEILLRPCCVQSIASKPLKRYIGVQGELPAEVQVNVEEENGGFVGDVLGVEDASLCLRCNIYFYPWLGLMRCALCPTPTLLRKGISDHMHRMHGVKIASADLAQVKARFWKPNNPYFVRTRTLLPPIPFLPIHRGFQCQACIFYCCRKAIMREHYRKKHPNEGPVLIPCHVQSIAPKPIKRYIGVEGVLQLGLPDPSVLMQVAPFWDEMLRLIREQLQRKASEPAGVTFDVDEFLMPTNRGPIQES